MWTRTQSSDQRLSCQKSITQSAAQSKLSSELVMSEDFGFVEINLAISAVFPYTKMIIELNYHFQSTNQFAQRSFQLHLKKMLKYGSTQQLIYNQRKLKSPSV